MKKIHRIIKFNQKASLKLYIDMKTKLRKNAKNDFQKDFFKLMTNAVFGKNMEKWENTEISSLWQPKQQWIIECQNQALNNKFFSEYLLAIEMKTTQILMNTPCLFRSINIRN